MIKPTLWMASVVALTACGDDSVLSSIEALDGDAAAGEALYEANCASCHGTDGTGGSGPNLVEEAPPKSEVIELVYYGEDAMPAFSDSLEDQEIADVTAYVVETLEASGS
jgi:mono/diheme cytochrome c family protein